MILILLAALVVIKRFATGSVLDKPQDGFLMQLVNSVNLFFLLIVNPLAAILMICRNLEVIDPTRIQFNSSGLAAILETAGLAVYVIGYLLMGWALICLEKNYQLGGSTPRKSDELVFKGPYRFLRHPMYAAALQISLGLAGLTRSWAFLAFFGLYLFLILLLIPVEEKGLREAYGRQYAPYRQRTKKLLPLVY
ncbi:MAG: isoprenylcysteine carboxylmethyltransferase family protein [Deltaproteobacteria bacterium]|nr:isoprenylcysteine carboxylmethyltransferase family protein [Deltaproteobacteria bacterium]